MQYRRANSPGACYFFTVNLAERNKSLLFDHVDHLHAIWNCQKMMLIFQHAGD